MCRSIILADLECQKGGQVYGPIHSPGKPRVVTGGPPLYVEVDSLGESEGVMDVAPRVDVGS